MITDYRPWRDLTGYVYHCDGGWLKTETFTQEIKTSIMRTEYNLSKTREFLTTANH